MGWVAVAAGGKATDPILGAAMGAAGVLSGATRMAAGALSDGAAVKEKEVRLMLKNLGEKSDEASYAREWSLWEREVITRDHM
ncbi:hypothetical protein LWI29_033034 [Acer saccharum]|uniref:Uncharacterized protein n=1 Tax=Acer saccharum TaxID=4024 RepID=A0AA39S840_ACESA|nr:hypothetical protein LWI29_033034 [Acer saccharum]